MNPQDRPEEGTINENLLLRFKHLEESVAKLDKLLQTPSGGHDSQSDSIRFKHLEESVAKQDELLQTLSRDHASQSVSKRSRTALSSFLHDHVVDFFGSVSLPGLRYVGESARHGFHRLLWMTVNLVAVTVSLFYISESYTAWQESPIVLTLNNTLTHVSQVPFPAITICTTSPISNEFPLHTILDNCSPCFEPHNCTTFPKCNVTNRDNCNRCLIDNGEFCSLPDNCSKNDYAAMIAFNWLCRRNNRNNFKNAIIKEKLEDIIAHDNSWDGHQINYFIEQMASSCYDDEFVTVFKPGNFEMEDWKPGCSTLQVLFTGHLLTPVCYTFNSLLPEDLYETNVVPPVVDERRKYQSTTITGRQWSTDNMKLFTDNIAIAPKHVYSNKQFSHNKFGKLFGGHGVLFLITQQDDYSTACGAQDEKSKIILHHPGEVPMADNTRAYSFKAGTEQKVYVIPKLITADTKLAKYEPARRGCYFAHEHKLSLFKFYTEKNCQMECKVNTSLAICGCVSFYLPLPNKIVRVCETVDDIYCLSRKLDIFFQNTLYQPRYNDTETLVEVCNCLPDCNSLSYDFEVEDVTKNVSYRYFELELLIPTFRQRFDLYNYVFAK